MIRAISLLLVLSFGFAAPSLAQVGTISPGSVAAGWSGWAQCQVDTTGPSYSDRQTHTWVLTGAAPTMQGVLAIHPAAWSVVGSGTAQRTSGSQPSKAEWTTNVVAVSAPMAISVRATDKRIVIRPWHDRLGLSAATSGTEQATTAAARAPAPTPLRFQAWESTFPIVEGNPGGVIGGSSTLPTNATTSPMQPAGSTRSTSCTWQFAQAPTKVSGPPAPASIGREVSATVK